MSLFWNESHNAGPSIWTVALTWDRTPRPLRPTNRPMPKSFEHLTRPEINQHSREIANQVAAFWQTHYQGDDWVLDITSEVTHNILMCAKTLSLVARDKEGKIIGTILGRPIVGDGGRICLGPTVEAEQAYMIEGLCIHSSWRGKHLAGWLISWIDYLLNIHRPQVIFWCREVASGIHTSDIALHTYAYIRADALQYANPKIEEIVWFDFHLMWQRSCQAWKTNNSILTTKSAVRSWEEGMIRVWCDESDRVVVVSNTRRKTKQEGLPIWEVVWCGILKDGYLIPATRRPEVDFRPMLESVTLHGCRNGILFTTDAVIHGGAKTTWSLPWKFGTSGFHASYIYGWMPPAFWHCDLMFIRTEV